MSAEDWPYSAVERPNRRHERTRFSCDRPELNRYLVEQAGQDERNRVAAAYVVVERGTVVVVGYYTLSSYSVLARDFPPEVIRRFARYQTLPATLIGRLAVDEKHTRRGVGPFLLIDALKRSLAESAQIGSCAVVVEAIDDRAIAFYQRFGCVSFPDQPRRLFMSMQTISQLP